MALKERLMADMKLAMKNKDVIRKNTVQMVRSAILQYEKDNQTELDDEGIIDVIAKELKQRRDSLPDFEKSGRGGFDCKPEGRDGCFDGISARAAQRRGACIGDSGSNYADRRFLH